MIKYNLSNLKLSKTERFLTIALSMGAGAYHGYCDAHGIPFEKGNLEWALTYGPAVVQGGLGAIEVGIVGLTKGRKFGDAICDFDDSSLEKNRKEVSGAIIGGLAGASLGGTIGGIKGGIQTLAGYGIGYSVGYLFK